MKNDVGRRCEPLSLKASIIIVTALQVWLFVDQVLLNYVNKILASTFNPFPYTMYKAISLFLIAIVIAFFAVKGRVPVILAIIYIVLDLCICIFNIPFFRFVNSNEPFVFQIGFLCFKLIQRLYEIKTR